MSWVQRFFKGVQGKVNEAGEAAADELLPSECEQRIRDAKAKREEVRDSAAKMKAQLKLTQREIEQLGEEFEQEKSKLQQLIQKHPDHELKSKLLDKIRGIQSKQEMAQQKLETEQKAADQLKNALERINGDIAANEQRITMLKSQRQVIEARKASSSAAAGFSSTMGSAGEAMGRLEKKNAEELAILEAREDLANPDGDMDAELEKLGVGTNSKSDDDLMKELGL